MGRINLEQILFKNWSSPPGGISEAVLVEQIVDKDLERIMEWFSHAHISAGMPLSKLTLKEIIDIASWCSFGTQALYELPPDRRQRRLSECAKAFKLDTKVLVGLMVTASFGD